MGAAESIVAEESPWLIRPYETSDTDALRYLLGVAYTRTKAGWRAGACGDGGRLKPASMTVAEEADMTARQKAFREAHAPVWEWMFQHADIAIACDPEAPHIIYAWLVTSGPDVLHAVGCKRSFCARVAGSPPVSIDLVTDLLGDRLRRFQLTTMELPQMRARKSEAIGIDRPANWGLDPTWLLTRMVRR